MHLDVSYVSSTYFFFRSFVFLSSFYLFLCLPFPGATATYPFLPMLEALRFLEWILRFSHLNLPYSFSRYVHEHSPRYEYRCALGRISPEEARGWWQLVRLQASSMSLSSWDCRCNHFRLCAFSFLRTFRHACHMLTARKRPRSGKNIVMVGSIVIVHRSEFTTTHRAANDAEMYAVYTEKKAWYMTWYNVA